MARWDPEKKVFYYTPGKNFESGIQEIGRASCRERVSVVV